MPVIGVLADDLTGAMAAAAILRQRGIPTTVQWEEITAESADAVVVNMATRELHAPRFLRKRRTGPRSSARRFAEELRQLGCRRVSLRVDSMLHGHAADELDGILDIYADVEPVVYAVPAWPAAKRITQRDRQIWFNADGSDGEADLRQSLIGGRRLATIDAPKIAAELDATIAWLDEQIAAGTRSFIGSAATDEHLRQHALIASALEDKGFAIVTASSGAWLRHFPITEPRRAEFTLLGLVSSSPITRNQLEHLVEMRPATVVLSAAEAIDRCLGQDDELRNLFARAEVIAVCDFDDVRDIHDGLSAAEQTADALRAILEAARRVGVVCRGIVASGGYTVWKICEELAESRTIEPVRMVTPLCALGRISGGSWSGLTIVSKGGWTGDEETLVELVDHLQLHHLDAYRDETGGLAAIPADTGELIRDP
jgi:D-threonate/D-erythronate kinase